MFTADSTPLDDGRAHKTVFHRDGQPLSIGQVMEAWQHDNRFVDVFIAQLAGSAFRAYQWETPPVTRAGLDRPFEMVLIDDHHLADFSPNRAPFAANLREAENNKMLAVRFANLGGDAMLVAPVGADGEACCTHLAAFSRAGSQDRQRAFWCEVGRAMDLHVQSDPVWLSTAGHGVHWLHVRLDSRPKYYRHRPYRASPEGP